MPIQTIGLFCGSNTGKNEVYAEATRALVRVIVASGVKIVFGGGKVGLMGVIAETALAEGGHVIGVTPQKLLQREMVHTGLTELHVVESMHERKVMMNNLADAFVALPGGMGTLDEIFEALTLTQLGVHRKACGFLNVAGYYGRLMDFLDHSVNERFVRAEHRDMIVMERDPQQLLTRLGDWTLPEVSKWMDRKSP